MFKPGDIILANIQFTDTFEIKIRPAVVLFEEHDNIVIAGITSNTSMNGILLTKKEGAVKDSIIKLNYIFTISSSMIHKMLFHLSSEKKELLYTQLNKKLTGLK
ncbi:type II toxin-antitoxin system PemK/MazF family toxin [archaeon]|nr:type II toxin-antitoxin system PemK/MazF family toxin [archaeon]